MLAACVRVLAEWRWAERPVGVVAMPSRSRPLLVDSLARGLAEVGRLPYLGALDSGRRRAHAASPAATARSASPGCGAGSRADGLELPDGPILLVDDLADSRWTLTVAARTLRQAGATDVLPFTLALRA